MDTEGQTRLNELQADFEEASGNPFSYFYCPILYRDEDVELCKGHIVNAAFPDIRRHWIVQRAGVDSFFGRCFESEFVNIQHQGSVGASSSMVDKELSKTFRPSILLCGSPVPYYYSPEAIATPPNHSKLQLVTEVGTVDLRLKLSPEQVGATNHKDWEIRVEKDMRLPALVSLLKAAHLTLFKMLGYRYVLSAGGHFMGRSILGDFFLQNETFAKPKVLQNASAHFKEFANLVRPVICHDPYLEGTSTDNRLYVCETASGVPWAFMIFVRTTRAVHAVIVPIFEHPDGISRFMSFLQNDGGRIEGRLCRFENREFKAWPKPTVFSWPEGGFE